MYGAQFSEKERKCVAGPCEFLVMYGEIIEKLNIVELQDPVNF